MIGVNIWIKSYLIKKQIKWKKNNQKLKIMEKMKKKIQNEIKPVNIVSDLIIKY